MKPNDFFAAGVRVAGWVPELGRLLLVAAATWSRYYIALDEVEPPVRLMGAKYFQGWYWLLGMPEFMMPTGHGEYFVGWGFLNGWLSNPYRYEADHLVGMETHRGFWGDLLLTLETNPSRLWEYVRYDGWGDPGDVIFLDTFLENHSLGWYHMMLRSGARGGLAQAWRRGEIFNNPWGMDVREDGLLCLVDRGRRGTMSYGDSVVHIMAPSTPNRIPDVFLLTIAGFPDATDCHFTGEDSVYILIPDPPTLVRYEMWTEAWEVVEELPEGSYPLDLVERPDGDVEILYKDGGLRGFLYLKDERRLEMGTDSFVVTDNGQAVADLGTLIWATPEQAMSPESHTYARFVERPDGLVVAAPFGSELPSGISGRLLVFDPNTPLNSTEDPGYWPLTAYDTFYPHEGSPLAVMPGGAAVDPWTGAEITPPGALPPDIPPTWPPPSDGAPVLEGSSGCHAAPDGGRPDLLLLTLAILLGILRAFRRTTAPCSS